MGLRMEMEIEMEIFRAEVCWDAERVHEDLRKGFGHGPSVGASRFERSTSLRAITSALLASSCELRIRNT